MGFNELSHEGQIQRLTELAAVAVTAYAVDSPRLELLKYRENAVFALTGAGGTRYVLRIHRPCYRTDDDIRSELAWMKALSQNGVITPAAVPTITGDVLTVVGAEGFPQPRQCDLLTWIEGKPLGTLEAGVALDEAAVRATYRSVGETAARIHDHGRQWKKPAGFSRPAWDADALVGDEPTFGRFWEIEELDDDQRRLLFRARDRARATLEAFGKSGDHYGLTHGDLVPDNILIGDAGLRVVDFDDCGDSWDAFELATSVFPLHGGPAFEPARAGYLEGYRAVRELAAAELELMPTFLMARGLSYLGWPAGRREMQSGRDLAPLLAYLVTDLARKYLDDEL
jgi:Ser/Thr protein kinase RdoA (MazF antagonist)